MATKYETKEVDGSYEISRNDVHVGTYDPISEETTYIGDGEKYAGPIGRQVHALNRATPKEELVCPDEPGIAEDQPTPEEVAEIIEEVNAKTAKKAKKAKKAAANTPTEIDNLDDAKREIDRLRRYCGELRIQLEDLRASEISKDRRRLDRYQHDVDETTAPVKDPKKGDLTPEYIEWARNGGMTPEVFIHRYINRIKDLSVPGESQ